MHSMFSAYIESKLNSGPYFYWYQHTECMYVFVVNRTITAQNPSIILDFHGNPLKKCQCLGFASLKLLMTKYSPFDLPDQNSWTAIQSLVRIVYNERWPKIN